MANVHLKSLEYSLPIILFNSVKPTHYVYCFCSKLIHKKLLPQPHNILLTILSGVLKCYAYLIFLSIYVD